MALMCRRATGNGGIKKKKRSSVSEVNVEMSSWELSSMPWLPREGLMAANLAQKETFS